MDEALNLPSRLPQTVAEALARGETVLTPNQRAAHALRRAYASSMRQTGKANWATPEILALDSWMTQLWHSMTVSGTATSMLLNRSQELALWRRILAEDPETPGLRSLDSLAELASSTWHRLCLYNGRARLSEAGVSTDTKAFQRWAKSFVLALGKSGYLCAAQLPGELNAALARGELPLADAGLLLVDFDATPPALEELFESLRQASYTVAEHRTAAPSRSLEVHTAPDERSELEAAVRWIRRELETDPTVHIAIIVPDLAARRAEIARVFGQGLAPELEQVESSPGVTQLGPFEFSLGTPLGETPMIVTALDLLRWCFKPMPLATISELLLSPFFGSTRPGAEQFAVAEFDLLELRKRPMLRAELSLEAMILLLADSPRRLALASLLQRLKSLQHAAQSDKLTTDHRQSHGEWSDAFRALLEAAGWTASAHSSSIAFQLHRRFEGALDELATLDFEGSRVSASAALAALLRIARQTIFAPESQNPPVHILGPLEVGGVPFDALWFLGADDFSWPQTPAVTPLVPWQLQRSLGMPGSDTARDHAAAREVTERIAGSARRVVFSFAARTEEGEQRLSPALAGLRLTNFIEAEVQPSPEPAKLEKFRDRTSIPPLPDRITRGGAKVLESQAACAFRAFAEHRLWSEEPGLRVPGLDPMERGSLVHKVMEHFWTLIPDREALKALTSLHRQFTLDECIDVALERAAKTAETAWDKAYLQAQRQRLHNLLSPWLDLEVRRPAFKVRHKEERLAEARLGPLRLSLRVDRMDETPLGPVILDYKTGNANPNDWLTERPDAPQLPLYAILSEEPVAGVAFAVIRAGKDLALKGFADSTQVFGTVANKKIRLSDQVEEWRQTLTSLAIAFNEGEARPDPKTYPRTCAYCTQRIVCRLDPATLRPMDDEEELFGDEDFSFG